MSLQEKYHEIAKRRYAIKTTTEEDWKTQTEFSILHSPQYIYVYILQYNIEYLQSMTFPNFYTK